MRIAVLQIELDPASRAENVQRIGASIDVAAAAVPPPDLIALPGACDTGGTDGGSGWLAASLTAVRERIAWKAKEWGVYIAAGLHRRRGDSLEPWNVLIDPDGDVAADTWRVEPRVEGLSRRCFATAFGNIGVADLLDFGDRSAVATDGWKDDAVVIVPMVTPSRAKTRRSMEAIVTGLRSGGEACGRACLIVVGPGAGTGNGAAVRSFVRRAGGAIVAEADGMAEQILHTEVALGTT